MRNVSLKVAPGQTVALVGPSGAGKSTMFQLILRFYDPRSGAVSIDGVDIKDLDPAELRRAISVVQQNAPLFAGSAADNIRFGRPSASDEDVRAAAQAANADEFIAALPRATTPSSVKARLRFPAGSASGWRSPAPFCGDAPILLLDEATSALDSESERAIQDAFETISADRTTIVIAHRLATVLSADVIAVMEDGQIVDQGTHEELLARGGLYARLADLQFGDKKHAAE